MMEELLQTRHAEGICTQDLSSEALVGIPALIKTHLQPLDR